MIDATVLSSVLSKNLVVLENNINILVLVILVLSFMSLITVRNILMIVGFIQTQERALMKMDIKNLVLNNQLLGILCLLYHH